MNCLFFGLLLLSIAVLFVEMANGNPYKNRPRKLPTWMMLKPRFRQQQHKKSIFISTGYGPGGINNPDTDKIQTQQRRIRLWKALKEEIAQLQKQYKGTDVQVPQEIIDKLKKKLLNTIEEMKAKN